MPSSEVPRRGFGLPDKTELLQLLEDRNEDLGERLQALSALAYLEVEIDYSVLKAIKRNIRGESSLVSYVRCLGLAGNGAQSELNKYAKNRSAAVRAEAVFALVRYFPGGANYARSILAQHKLHPWQRVAALRGLAELDLTRAQVEAMRRLSSEVGEMVLECLAVLRRDLNDDHIPCLIDLLRNERSRATNEAAAMLRYITGYRIGSSHRAWQVAYLQHKATETPMRAPQSDGTQLQTVTYLGVPIFSDNICFVLDSSSSMTERMYELRRMTRATKVVEEFTNILPTLPATSNFNVIFFESTIRDMFEELQAVTSDSKEYASVFVSTNEFAGGTNLYGGIKRAFELDGVEELIVLSDGDPSVGEFTVPWQILVELDSLNRWRNIRISSISFSAPRAAESLMYMIAAHNHGHFMDID